MWFVLVACAADPAPRAIPAPAPPAPATDPVLAASDPWSLQQAAQTHGLPWPPPQVRITVDKSARELDLFSGDTRLERYRVGLGGAPSGDKVQRGDQRTPDGDLTVVSRNPNSHYHLFLGLSYPDPADADRGLRAGLVTEAQADAIRTADAAGTRPPWSTRLGGAIGIHGRGGSADWTLGCIAVDDAEIEEIWALAPLGTPVQVSESPRQSG